MTNKYRLRYVEQFEIDLQQAALYIAKELCNRDAANKLIDDVEKAIHDRLAFAESFAPYLTSKKREDTYYSIKVRNYFVYYVVIDHKIMEVRRLLYKGQNRQFLLFPDTPFPSP